MIKERCCCGAELEIDWVALERAMPDGREFAQKRLDRWRLDHATCNDKWYMSLASEG